jgi:hypothetical protein
MIYPFASIAIAAQFVVAVSDTVPNIDYEKGCRAAATAEASLGVTGDTLTLNACLTDERNARDGLTGQWTQFPSGDRVHCAREAAYGELPSYVELQTCLQIARDTKTLPSLQSFAKKRK